MTALLNQIYRLFNDPAYLAIMTLIFLTVTVMVGISVYLLLRRDPVAERISKLADPKPVKRAPATELLQEEKSSRLNRLLHPLDKLAVPDDEAVRKKLRLRLVRAGFRSKSSPRTFLATKILCALSLPMVVLVRSFLYTVDPRTILVALLLGVSGFFLPDLALLHLTQKRQEGIRKALPDALDLMVVCVEAGLGLDMTFYRVGEEVRSLSSDMSDELHLTNLEIRAGKPREMSLKNLALRTGVPELQNLITILIQSNRFGTSIAKALRVHADGMRTKRRQLAEERAAKSTVKLLFPLILFIFPALLVVLVGPAAIRIVQELMPRLGGG